MKTGGPTGASGRPVVFRRSVGAVWEKGVTQYQQYRLRLAFGGLMVDLFAVSFSPKVTELLDASFWERHISVRLREGVI